MLVQSICDSVVAVKKCANVSKTSETIDEKRKEVHENLFVCAINDWHTQSEENRHNNGQTPLHFQIEE